jgi:ABC-2 type transport system ATP-binding protein
MDEADKLCDRIAIVDHGELKALDSPERLKAATPGDQVTLDDVFIYYTGRDLRDALQDVSPMDRTGFIPRRS